MDEKNEVLIEFRNVVRKYGSKGSEVTAVNDVSFQIDRGEFVVILGQSGAGKSTVMNMIGGMDKPTSGTIIVDGENVSAYSETQLYDYRAFKIGFIFQFYNLLTSLTAYENVALAKDIVKNAADPDEMLKAVGLYEKRKHFPSQMSGGEQQRVSIARALAKNPEIILGDEPTGALDSETGKMVLELLVRVCHEKKKTLIVVTHNADIAQCADKVIRMKNAKIVEVVKNDSPAAVEVVEW